MKRLEMEEVATSLAIERREKNLEEVKTLNAVNKSLEVEQLRLLRDFSKGVKISKKLRNIAE